MAEYVNKAESKQAVRDKWQDFETRVEVNYIVNCMPTINIVCCEVCKYWSLEKELTRLNGERYTVGYCCLEDKHSDCDWFCADGERRSDG